MELSVGAMSNSSIWRFSMKKSERILIALGIIQVIISILQLIFTVLWGY